MRNISISRMDQVSKSTNTKNQIIKLSTSLSFGQVEHPVTYELDFIVALTNKIIDIETKSW